jgi:hypothetical protein
MGCRECECREQAFRKFLVLICSKRPLISRELRKLSNLTCYFQSGSGGNSLSCAGRLSSWL